MRRRALLSTLGASACALAGCQGATSQPSTVTRTTSRTPTPATCEQPGGRRVELAGTAPVPADAALSVTAAMERERITADATARLRVEVTNDGTTRETTLADAEYCHLFNRSGGGSNPAGLWLYRRQDAPADRKGGCWTRSLSPADTRTYVAIGCRRRTLASAESVVSTYEVWDDYAADGYVPSGTYRFDAKVPLWKDSDDGEPDWEVEWWLDLRVAEVES